jgi:hypothetical protein
MSNCPASSLTTTASRRNPCAVTAPHSAPSVALPRGLVGKLAHRMSGQLANDRSGQGTLSHVGKRRVGEA